MFVCLNVIVLVCALVCKLSSPFTLFRGILHRSKFLSHSTNFEGMYSAFTVT